MRIDVPAPAQPPTLRYGQDGSDPPNDRHCRTCKCFKVVTVYPVGRVLPYRPDTPPATPQIVLPEGHLAAALSDDGEEEDEFFEEEHGGELVDHEEGLEGRWFIEEDDEPIVISDEEYEISERSDDDEQLEWVALSFVPPPPDNRLPPSQQEYSRPESDDSPVSSPTPAVRRSQRLRNRSRRDPVYRRFNVGSSDDEGEQHQVAAADLRRRHHSGTSVAERIASYNSPTVPSTSTSYTSPRARGNSHVDNPWTDEMARQARARQLSSDSE